MLTADNVDRLNQDMTERHLQGFWAMTELEPLDVHPHTRVLPHLWTWADVYGSLVRAGEVVSLEHSERRTCRLINPGLARDFTTNTVQLSVQYVKAGEHARAHRHSMAALRYVVQGRGAYTTVNGQQCVMAEGDLILTPHLTWHDHTNLSDAPIVWLDGLDMPLIQLLEQETFEPGPWAAQPITATSDEVGALYGAARPPTAPIVPYYHYRGRETEAALQALASSSAPSAADGYLLEYRNPATGGPTMPTIQCAIQMLPPAFDGRPHRHTSAVIYHIVRGSGSTFVGDARFDWEKGDSFVVPLCYAHRHVNRSPAERAVLFSYSDAPVRKALHLYYEEEL
jgi:gentisate 1,2-dioxygenase